MTVAQQMAPHSMVPTMSYAEAVATRIENTGQRRNTTISLARYGGSHSSVQLKILAGEKKWYTDAWVGRLKKQEIFERVDDEIPWILGSNVVPKYLGDDMVLLLGLLDIKAEEMSNEENNHGSSLFYSLEKWNPAMKPGNRLVWIQC